MSDNEMPETGWIHYKTPEEILDEIGAKWSPAFNRPGPLQITARDCVICGPEMDCICHTIEFGSDEYFDRLDRLHKRGKYKPQ